MCGRRRSAAGAGGRGTGRRERGERGEEGAAAAGPAGKKRGWRSQRIVWKEALGRRSKLSPSSSGCSSLSSGVLAEPFMSPVPSPPLPSRPGRSLPLLRALPPGALPGAECSRESAPGPPAAGTAGRGEARRGPWTEQGLLCPRRGPGGRGGASLGGEVGARRSPPSWGQGRRGLPRRDTRRGGPGPGPDPSEGAALGGKPVSRWQVRGLAQRYYLFAVLGLD